MDITPINIRTWSLVGACGAFGIAMENLAAQHADIRVLTADLCSFSGLNRFSKEFPNQLINVGIAEQNMIGIAAGLARQDFIPFCTSYASFLTLRCADQIKNTVGYMNLPIKLIGLTSGLSVGILGATHMCFEDIALMRAIPNLCILSPADCLEVIKCVQLAARVNKPFYIRMTGSMNNPPIYRSDYPFEFGKGICLREGNEIAIIATGSMVHYALKTAKILEEQHDISVKVINIHTLKPIDKEIILSCKNAKLLVTLEEHSIYGGLGSITAEVFAKETKKTKHLIIGLQDFYCHAAAYNDLLNNYELTTDKIYTKILNYYKGVFHE